VHKIAHNNQDMVCSLQQNSMSLGQEVPLSKRLLEIIN
jgi:hypothetical protein